MIHVPDVRATVTWYEKIGFTVKATYADETGDNFSFAIISFGEATEVMFNTDGETSDSRRREVDLYVYTDNIDELYERLKDSVDVVEKPHDTFYGMYELIIRDLNRFWITFGEESVFAILMGGVYESDEERVKRAVDSGRLDRETLNVALAFATSAVASWWRAKAPVGAITTPPGRIRAGPPAETLNPSQRFTVRPFMSITSTAGVSSVDSTVYPPQALAGS